MNHLVAFTGNEPELLACALFQARRALYWQTAAEPEGWGLGIVQGEEVLLRKNPRAESREVDFYAVARDLGADAMVGQVGGGEDGVGAAENSDPFRFRSWLFGMVGQTEGFDLVRERLLQSIPDFLRRNIHGRSSSEHIFHLFLAFLHDAGLLDVRTPEGALVQHALHQSGTFLDRLLTGTGLAASPLVQHALHQSGTFLDRLLTGTGLAASRGALVVTNGRALLAENRGVAMQFLPLAGITDCNCPTCPDKRDVSGQPRRINHPDLRAVVIEADLTVPERPGWAPVPDGHSLLVDVDRRPRVVANA